MVNVMAMVGSSIWMGGSGFGRFRAGDGLADGDAFHAGDGQDVARPADGFIDALQPFERIELGDLGVVHGAVALGDGHVVAVLERAVEDAADAEAAEIVAVIQVGDQHLEHAVGVADGRRDVLHDGVEQGRRSVASSSILDLATPVLAMV